MTSEICIMYCVIMMFMIIIIIALKYQAKNMVIQAKAYFVSSNSKYVKRLVSLGTGTTKRSFLGTTIL